MRAAVRSPRLYPSTSSFRTRPSHNVFRRSSAPSSIPRRNPLNTQNLLNPLASPIITPRSYFASPCIPAPTSPIIHEPQPLPHPCASQFGTVELSFPCFSRTTAPLSIPSRMFTHHRTAEHPIPRFHAPLHPSASNCSCNQYSYPDRRTGFVSYNLGNREIHLTVLVLRAPTTIPTVTTWEFNLGDNKLQLHIFLLSVSGRILQQRDR